MSNNLQRGQRFPGAGRPKGAPNKATADLKALIAVACGADWDPVVEMAKIAKSGTMDEFALNPDTGKVEPTGNVKIVSEKCRQSCYKEVSEYIRPKRRAIEVSDPDGDPLSIGVLLNIAFDEPRREEG